MSYKLLSYAACFLSVSKENYMSSIMFPFGSFLWGGELVAHTRCCIFMWEKVWSKKCALHFKQKIMFVTIFHQNCELNFVKKIELCLNNKEKAFIKVKEERNISSKNINRISKYLKKGMFFKQTFPTELLLHKNCRIVQPVKLMPSRSKAF